MLTKELKIVIAVAAAQMMIFAVIMAVYQPHLGSGTILCGLIVLAAEVVTFREVQAMRHTQVRAPRRRH